MWRPPALPIEDDEVDALYKPDLPRVDDLVIEDP